MQSFSYTAFNSDGRLQKGHVEATDAADARRKLKARGVAIATLSDAKAGVAQARAWNASLFQGRFDTARFFTDLSVLMGAGLGIDQALPAIQDNASRGIDKRTIGNVIDQLASGASPSVALSHITGLPADVTALIASGERSARLAYVMTVVAMDLQRRAVQRKQIIDAAVYPIFLLALLTIALGVVTFVLVPTLEPIFESSGRPLPLVVSVLSGIRTGLADPIVFSSGLIGFTIIIVIGLLRPSAVGRGLSAGLAKLPLLGRALSQSALARYLQSLGLLLENAVPLSEALSLAARSCPRASYHGRLLSMRDDVISGKRLSEAMTGTGLFPRGVVSLIAIGDEVNRLPAVLENASGILRSDAQRTIDRLLALMTPVITIILGIVIGGLVVSVMTALLGINELSMQ